MLSYQPISDIQQDIFDCCEKNPGDIPPSGDCCYDTWKKDLDQVTADWRIASTIAAHKQKHYDNTYAWYQKIKAWCDSWIATDEKADALCRQLELFITHLERICQVTEKTGKAIEILFCMTKDLYMRVDKLKEEYDELMQCINCLKSPDLAPGAGIVKCLEEYGAKLDAVIATRDELILKIITALELAYSMHTDLCEAFGLKQILIYWRNILHCAGCDENSGEYRKQGRGIINSGSGSDCCDLDPVITFPLDNDPYYKSLQQECMDLKAKTDQLKQQLDKANSKRDALQAGKDSLTTAIQQVDPKTRCK
jgi:FtsZ-binding cell division protein ZapB